MQLELPFPPSVNHLWRRYRNRMVLSREGRAYKREVRLALLQLGVRPLDGPIAVSIDVHPPDRRRRDLDNALKCLLDALEHGGAFRDDSQIDHLTISRCDRVKGGKVTVQIDPLSLSPQESQPMQVAKKRKCLKCDKPFASTGAGNRICSPCQRLNAKLPITELELEAQRGGKFHNGIRIGLDSD